jgi:hypothetical protein
MKKETEKDEATIKKSSTIITHRGTTLLDSEYFFIRLLLFAKIKVRL